MFARGDITSSSRWCQASGFLLSLSIEASDFAILLIALHAVLYVFRPPIRVGEGGLYPYRRWLPLAWLGFPILSASLAFVNSGNAYVTAGTFCYLPQRPIWYRLALAWIPRYIILFVILGMYAAISIYVRIKFRSFKNLAQSDPPTGDNSARRGSLDELEAPTGMVSPRMISGDGRVMSNTYLSTSDQMPGSPSSLTQSPQHHHEPWDSMNFITSNTLESLNRQHQGIQAADFAARLDHSEQTITSPAGRRDLMAKLNSAAASRRQSSELPSRADDTTGASQRSSSFGDSDDQVIVDPLKRTRMAIRQQLRFLFIYPAVYMAMWAFPFANHCLLYSDALASHPIFWLQILSTATLPLQAAVDCLVFSIREKPWRRIDKNSKLSFPFWRSRSASILKRMSHPGSMAMASRRSSNATERRHTSSTDKTVVERPQRGPDWWEAEGKKRKDSVWLGTDLMTYLARRDSSGPSLHDENGDKQPS